MTFADFSIPKVIFHDFPDMENCYFKFHDFTDFARIVRYHRPTLCKFLLKVYLLQPSNSEMLKAANS